jgi:hypothetical protein
MANKSQSIDQNQLNTFVKGLNKDLDPSFVSEGMWTHARNATNNTREGDAGSLSNEPANVYCTQAGATLTGVKYIIGTIHLFSDKWIIFTVAHQSEASNTVTGCEIGLLEETSCKYRIIVQDICLAFSKWHLITGAARKVNDCSWQVYWADGKNPDRYMNVGDPQTWPANDYQWVGNNQYSNGPSTIQWPGVPWLQLCSTDNGCQQTEPGVWPIGCPGLNDCITCEDTSALNCDELRLSRLMQTPCIQVSAGKAGGNLRNGSYMALIAYAIEGTKVTDFFSPSNVQPLWYDNETSGALEIDIQADQEHFDEFILIVVATVNQAAVAKQVGIYSTSTTKIYIDQIKEDIPAFPLEQLPIQTPVYETSDQIVEVNNYLLKVGPTTKFDFNYQPLANLIKTNWVSVEYPSDYYVKGGYKPSYLRDEVYAFFIRWVYNTGDKSAAYHIPGRPAKNNFVEPCTLQVVAETAPATGSNTLFDPERIFEVYNTATITSQPTAEFLPDGGQVIARGEMGYWESTEKYPDKQPNIWNSSAHCWTNQTGTEYDLCGKPIRHHKFPDTGVGNAGQAAALSHFRKSTTNGDNYIRIMGVEFNNIICPKDNNGQDIPDIVGYEILRGSREGNKSIVAKGMLNNMRPYNINGQQTDNSSRRRGLYPNHPFNTIKPVNPANSNQYGVLNTGSQINDPYIRVVNEDGDRVNVELDDMPKNIMTFHSPDTNFKNPYISTPELKVYGNIRGTATQSFIQPENHPQNKLISNYAAYLSFMGGAAEALISLLGKRHTTNSGPGYTRKFGPDYEQEDINGGSGTFTNIIAWAGPAGTATLNGNFTDLSGNGGVTEEDEYTENGEDTDPDGAQNTQDFVDGPLTTYNQEWSNYFNNGGLWEEGFGNGQSLSDIYDTFNDEGGFFRGGYYTPPSGTTDLSKFQYFKGSPLQTALSLVGVLNPLLYYFSEGASITLDIIYALLPYRQYALQQQSHGFYDTFVNHPCSSNFRFKIEDSFYLKDSIQDAKPYFDGEQKYYRINNLKRQTTFVVRTVDGDDNDTGPDYITDASSLSGYADTSLVTIGTAINNQLAAAPSAPVGGNLFDDKHNSESFNSSIASHYAGLKYRIQNQYGQLDSIKLIPITPCEQDIPDVDLTVTSTFCIGYNEYNEPFQYQLKLKVLPPTISLFNGDTYINRYTEKNSMFFFYDWMYNQPDGTEFNYLNRQMLPEPRFWMNSARYEVSTLFTDPTTWFTNINGIMPGTGVLPRGFYNLDHAPPVATAWLGILFPQGYNYSNDNSGDTPGICGVKESYFYLATSSVRDFFVESDVIVDFRIAGDEQWQKFYNPYEFTDLKTLFNMNPDIIQRGNYYRYDYSLSISKLFTQYFSQGNLQSRYYDPAVAKLCYTYYPNRILYSLPQNDESSIDTWSLFLTNNYKDFIDNISGVKNFAKTGVFITFKNSSPLVFQGVDQLETTSGTKVTLGDGGLFAQTPQAIVIADKPYEYGSSQGNRSVISTPAGLFYLSQNQGKVFTYSNGLNEISQNGLKWWFSIFMPYKITEDFPEYPHLNNPVAAVGCQSIYDSQNSIVYFCKKDYKLKEQFKGQVTYDKLFNTFRVGKVPIQIGHPDFFDDASWTVSYDPKSQLFISFHDWYPDLLIPTKTNFLSTKNGGMWKHNASCTTYCNYYGVDKPFEVEFPIITGQTVVTKRSLEYILECYKRSNYNCVDQFQVLDFNFDQAVVFNAEQVSGYLNLNLFPKNNVTLSLQYPQVNLNSIDILFSKEENKYRFNQFWDITKDRGEFPTGSNYPPTGPLVPGTTVLQGPYTEEFLWMTEPNGYIKSLNPTNLDYQKPELQRKKFRHYINFLNLSRSVSGNVNMVLKIVNSKNVISPR